MCKKVRNICRSKREFKEIVKRVVKEAEKAYIVPLPHDRQAHYTLNLLCVPKKDALTGHMTEIIVTRHGSYATRRTESLNQNISEEKSKIETLPNLSKYLEKLIEYE